MAQKTINLKIINVSQPTFNKTAQGGYNKIEVTFKDAADGRVGGKPLVDFNTATAPFNKDVYAVAQGLKEGDEITVILEKKEGEKFWNWTSATRSAGVAAAVNPQADQAAVGVPVAVAGKHSGDVKVASGRGRVTGSTYETPAERAVKQIYIVRQSSISAAIALLQSQGGVPFDTGNVIEKAREFEAYVFEKTEKTAGRFDDMDDDIPF